MLRRGLSRAQIQRWASQATLECSPATMYLLEDAPPTKATITAEEAVKYYTEMQTIRRMELKADQLYKQKGTGTVLNPRTVSSKDRVLNSKTSLEP